MIHRNITLLDLGGVVFQSTGESNERIDWEVITKLNNIYGYELNIGADKFPEFLCDYNIMTNQKLTGDLFLEYVFDTLEINMDLINFLRTNSQIIIVSDNYRENIAYISERFKFSEWAIKQIYSFDYKMVKSDTRFFTRLLEELSEYKIEEMIFIDDSQSKIASARKNGICGVLYKNNAQVVSDITSLKSGN